MIQPNKGTPQWLDNKNKMERKSASEGAMSSFAKSVLNQANKMKQAGKSDDEIAKAFNVEKSTLKKVLKEATSEKNEITCDCENDNSSSSYEDRLKEAEAVNNSLRGRKSSSKEEAPMRRDKSIMSAKGGRMDISNEVGSKKVMGSQTNNSVWDTEKLERASKTMDNGERIRREKELLAKKQEENKYISRNTTIDGTSLKDALSGTDQRKDTTIKSMPVNSPAGYTKNLSQKGISIFDDGFSRVPEKTAGEKMAEEARKPKVKDRSWVEDGSQPVTSKGRVSKMIDSMLDKPKE
jgi:hypothetical protein